MTLFCTLYASSGIKKTDISIVVENTSCDVYINVSLLLTVVPWSNVSGYLIPERNVSCGYFSLSGRRHRPLIHIDITNADRNAFPVAIKLHLQDAHADQKQHCPLAAYCVIDGSVDGVAPNQTG